MAAIYRATFNSYTELKISMACYKDDDIRYETIDKDGSILITEHELDFYKNFRNGFNKLEFVGYLRPYAKYTKKKDVWLSLLREITKTGILIREQNFENIKTKKKG